MVAKSVPFAGLISDLRELILIARDHVARTVNSSITILYWRIGNRILKEILKNRRAEYGKEILQTVSAKLVAEFGDGFSPRNLANMIKFAECFPDERIVPTLSAQLGWSHFVELLSIQDDLKRQFYAEVCRIERWSVRQLREKIGSMLYERTALSKKPVALIKKELKTLHDEKRLTPDMIFRDPYFLDFLGLKDTYSEKDLEAAILRELERFIMELGSGFSFVARQKRITVDNEDYYLDLLFYHRSLQRLVAVELKLDKFRASYKGQMELYLRWLEKYEMRPHEEPPVGLILCAGKSDEQIELLQLGKSGIRVAAYLTELPPRELLRKKLHDAIIVAREKFQHK